MKNFGEELGWEARSRLSRWANTEIYVKTISKGYLLSGETPKDAYWRVSTTVARSLGKPQMASKFFDYIWKRWLNLSNTCTYLTLVLIEDYLSVVLVLMLVIQFKKLVSKNLEMMLLAKHGGGVGVGMNMIRPAGK